MSRLSDLIAGAAVKRLSLVEASRVKSNQHELNGTSVYRALFGGSRKRFPATFLYLTDGADPVVSSEGSVTWYDSRENKPHRAAEYRLYFTDSDVTERLSEGDLAGVIRKRDGSVVLAFAQGSSTAEQQLLWLFDILAPRHRGWTVADFRRTDRRIGLAARAILAQLGIELKISSAVDESHSALLLSRYGRGFPPTAEFSAFARECTDDADPLADPDAALTMWLEREEALFRQLERHLVLERLRRGFADDVEAFVQYSLSVQNRRKSRVGYALEHHVRAILEAHKIPFSYSKTTERDAKPDFLFPSTSSYQDAGFPAAGLRMLAVKSTCKDRWRQILAEADRIRVKHLLTLEPSISRAQTEQMESKGVVLVVPTGIQETYHPDQRGCLLSVKGFISLVKGTGTLTSEK